MVLTSCSDEPDSEYFYTFTGEMMSDYIASRPCYSEFYTILTRAGMLDLLSTYGQYTCLLPNNDAVEQFLSSKGLTSVDQLSDADCDTIARTHLLDHIYSTFEMDKKTFNTTNMLGRYLATSQGVDADSNAVVYIEKTAHIIFEQTLDDGTFVHQNDSVENGIIQPVTKVIEKSNSFVADILRDNPNISIFYDALVKTGVSEQIRLVSDPTYSSQQPRKNYISDFWNEIAWVPDTKKYGFTAFVEPDSLYEAKFREYNISTANGNLRALYDLACLFYDQVYPEDVNADGHSFDNLTSDVNPLRRFIQYHILNRYVSESDNLTPFVAKETGEAFGFDTELCNPTEWFQTLLPYTMIKIEQLSKKKRRDPLNPAASQLDIYGDDSDKKGQHFVNRRYESPDYEYRGAYVQTVTDYDADLEPDAVNGHYFYVDDLVVFSKDVRDIVQNMRIRMDFSAIFPEIMNNDIRMKGTYTVDDNSATADDSQKPKNGRNYYFPLGYLDGVSFNSSCLFVMRRPHCNFWSWQGDEWNLFGDYDISIRIPPVPFSGEWQLRLGFCAIPYRGVMQAYFDGVPQGIPLDMTKYLNSDLYIGSRFVDDETLADYKAMSDEDRAAEQKVLRNLGAYRAGRSIYHFPTGGNHNYFAGNPRTYRKILYQGYIDATKDHYIRFRVGSEAVQGHNNEFMLDYFEMVPKSVYGIDGEGEMEDDL